MLLWGSITRWGVPTVVAVSAVVAVGCSSAPAPEPSAADASAAGSSGPVAGAAVAGFGDDLDRITDEYADRAAVLQAELAAVAADDEERLLQVVDALHATATEARSTYASLAIPAPVSAEMTALLQLLDDQARALTDLSEAVRARDTAAFRAATDELIAIAQRSARARQDLEVALTACGDPCGS